MNVQELKRKLQDIPDNAEIFLEVGDRMTTLFDVWMSNNPINQYTQRPDIDDYFNDPLSPNVKTILLS